MMRWIKGRDLAGLPGMPGTTRGILRRANCEGWPSRPAAGRGGGSEYLVAALPVATLAHLGVRSAANRKEDLQGLRLAAAAVLAMIDRQEAELRDLGKALQDALEAGE